MIKKIFAITLIFILAAGCNKKDDSTGPTVTNDQNLVATWDLGSMKVNGAAANQNNFEGIPIKIIRTGQVQPSFPITEVPLIM